MNWVAHEGSSEWLLWRIVFIETYGAIAAWVSVSELQYIIKRYFKSHYRLLCSHNHTITHPYHRTIVLSQPQCSTMFQLSICSFMIHMRHPSATTHQNKAQTLFRCDSVTSLSSQPLLASQPPFSHFNQKPPRKKHQILRQSAGHINQMSDELPVDAAAQQ